MQASQEVAGTGLRTLDEQWLDLARTRLPNFAGFHIDRDRTVVVSLAGPGNENEALRALRERRNPRAHDRARTRYVQYRFTELHEWRARIMGATGGEAVYFDVDEVENRVTVGVTSEAAVSGVLAAAATAGVPEEALHVLMVGPGPHHRGVLLKDHGGEGGTRITYRSDSASFNDERLCTLGAVGTFGTKDIFVTAAHCTATKFGLDSSVVRQEHEDNGSSVDVAVEILDPTYSDVDTDCWVFDLRGGGPGADSVKTACRHSDAALYEWYSGALYDLYEVAQTESVVEDTVGSRTISESAPHFAVSDAMIDYDELWVGQQITKVGERSGWTAGEIMQCIDGYDATKQTTNCDPVEDIAVRASTIGMKVWRWLQIFCANSRRTSIPMLGTAVLQSSTRSRRSGPSRTRCR